MPATMDPDLDIDRGSTQKSLGRRVLAWLLVGFSSSSYPLMGPMCIWLPHPPRLTRPQAHPDPGRQDARH